MRKKNTKARAKAKMDKKSEHEQIVAAPKKSADQKKSQDIKKRV